MSDFNYQCTIDKLSETKTKNTCFGVIEPIEFVAKEPFDIGTIDLASLGVAYGVGFTIVGVPMVIAACVGYVIRSIKQL